MPHVYKTLLFMPTSLDNIIHRKAIQNHMGFKFKLSACANSGYQALFSNFSNGPRYEARMGENATTRWTGKLTKDNLVGLCIPLQLLTSQMADKQTHIIYGPFTYPPVMLTVRLPCCDERQHT